MTRKTGALVLAAGFSQRFGSIKLCAKLDNGKTVFQQTLQRISTNFHTVTVVTRPELFPRLACDHADIHAFDHAERGMGATLAYGIGLVQEWDACLICLADMPFIQEASYQLLADALSRDNIVIPVYQGQAGNPVGFGRAYFSHLQQLSGDCGGRPVVREYPEAVARLNIDDPAILWDIDTPDDLARYQEKV